MNIRGTEPRLNSMMIDGQRIPSPDPLIRQVAVDVVPSELLQSIEVSKALTPDMDADSIGGSVNLVMKQAPEKLRLFGAVGGGYNELSRQLQAEQLQPDDRSPVQRRQDRPDRLGERLGDEPRQPGHGGRLHANPDAQRIEPALVPGQPPSHRVHRSVRRQAERQLPVHGSRRLQPVHRRPREPSACALSRSPTAASITSCAIARTSSGSRRSA